MPLDSLADLHSLRDGSDAAWEDCVRRNWQTLHQVARSVLNDHALAEDAVQEGLLKAKHSIDDFTPPRWHVERAFAAWLKRIVARTAMDVLRSRRAAERREQRSEPPQPTPGPLDQLCDQEERERLHGMLGQLDEADRLVLGLTYIADLPADQVAQAVGCPQGALRMRLSRARRRLKERLERRSGAACVAALTRLGGRRPSNLPRILLANGALLIFACVLITIWLMADSNEPVVRDEAATVVMVEEKADPTETVALRPAVGRAVAHLVSRQEQDGAWNGQYGRNVGETGLCVLALLSSGVRPGETEHGRSMSRAIDWMLDQVEPSGLIQETDQATQAPVMYGHAFAMLALSQCMQLSSYRQKEVARAVRRGSLLVARVQGPKGGWNYRYIPKDGDVSVSAAQLISLVAARQSGAMVPEGTLIRGLAWLDQHYDATNQAYGYSNDHFNINMIGSSAAATAAQAMLDPADAIHGRETFGVLQAALDGGLDKVGHDCYLLYYGSISAYRFGGDVWENWRLPAARWLLAHQRDDGSWGSYHATAMAVLAATIDSGGLPAFTRPAR